LKEPTDVLGQLRVASPCGVSWDSMAGDERVRFCRLCSLNVYDFAGMTRAEIEALVLKTEGRLCGRMTRRADGTVLTKDCPVGLRALRLRATRAAGAAFAALLSLCSLASGQTKSQKLSCASGGQVNVERKAAKNASAKPSAAAVSGVVIDQLGAFIPRVEVFFKDEATKKEFKAKTSDEGAFSLAVLPAGKYTLRVDWPGFTPLHVKHFEVKAGEDISLNVLLGAGITELGVIVSQDDYEHEGGKTVLLGRMLTDLPIPQEE
jgi:hypothetical protein